jgi:signal transduction histidine kinase/ligand-binding sensor domain-containing protein
MSRSRSYLVSAVALIALAAVGISRGASAEPASSWAHRAYQTEDGLPDNSITGMAQTSDGYLWVATKGGLVRFDGEEFRTLPRANFPSLPSRAVRAMFRDHKDRLWLSMERGPLLCLSPEGLQSYTVREGMINQRVVTLAEDKEGAIWVVHPSQMRRLLNGQAHQADPPGDWRGQGDLLAVTDARGDFWCAKGTQVGVWQHGRWQVSINLEAPVTAFSAGSRSNLWIAAGSRLFRCEVGQVPVATGALPTNAAAVVLFEDRSGALWIGTVSEGLFRWQGGEMEKVPTSHREITSIYEDQEGNLWAGTAGGGLNLIRPRAATLIGRDSDLPFDSVISITADAGGNLWAAAQDGQLARGRNGRWELITSASNWPGGNATCVAADPGGGVWVGTSARGLNYFRDGVWRKWTQRDGLINDGVRSLMVASNGDVWVASLFPVRLQRLRDGRVQVLENTTKLGALRAMAESADGTVWIGTAEGELQKVEGSTLVAEPAIQEPVPLSIRCLLATGDGSLWIGYAGEGLGRFKNGKYRRVTTADGLADDYISQLLPDGRGNLWITGNRGLWRVSFSELEAALAGPAPRLRVRAYGRADGLPGLQPNRDNSPSACRGNDGRLWFSMRNGLLVVEPGKVRDNPLPPPVELERVTVDDQLVALVNAGSPLQTQFASNVVNLRGLTAPLQIGPGHRKLEIGFAALSFASPENVQFRYRLSGFDADWNDVGSRHTATYPRLPAGNYEFRALACNNSGVWNQTGATLAITVSPFFWETWWFRVSGGMVTVLMAGGTALMISRRRYRQKLRRLEARRALEQERSRIARDIHDDLGASLTRITLLSQPPRNSPDDAQAAAASLAQIHQTARDLTHAMGEVVWAVNPEHDTFDSLANYVSHYAQNFLRVAGIRCRIEMPLQLPNRSLSAEIRHNLFLAFKEALNNVVKHAEASEVHISLTPGETGFELFVADNGKGLGRESGVSHGAGQSASRATPGNGLANMRSRLQEIGGDCEVDGKPGAGTRITFRVRLKSGDGQS